MPRLKIEVSAILSAEIYSWKYENSHLRDEQTPFSEILYLALEKLNSTEIPRGGVWVLSVAHKIISNNNKGPVPVIFSVYDIWYEHTVSK